MHAAVECTACYDVAIFLSPLFMNWAGAMNEMSFTRCDCMHMALPVTPVAKAESHLHRVHTWGHEEGLGCPHASQQQECVVP